MRISSIFLAISLSPLAGVPAFARDVTAPPPLVLAQADEGCPEGQNCSKKQKGEKQRKHSDSQQQDQAPQQQEAKPKQPKKEHPKASAHQQQQDQPADSEQPSKKHPPKQAKPAQQAAPAEQQAEQPSGGDRKRHATEQKQQAAPAEEPKAKQSGSSGKNGDKARRRAAADKDKKPAEEQAPAAATTEQPPAAAEQGNQEQPQGGAKKRDRRWATDQQEQQPAEEAAPAATAEQPAATPEEDQGKPGAGGKNRERRRAGGQQQEAPTGEPAAEAAAPQEPAAADQSTEEQPAAGEGNSHDRAVNRARQRQQQLKQREQAGKQPAEGTPAETDAGASTTEQQLEAQGDRDDADQVRTLRAKARERRGAATAAAARERRGRATDQAEVDADEQQTGFVLRRDRDRHEEVVERRGDRVIIREGDRVYVRPVVPDEGERLLYRARDVDVEHLGGGRTRTVVYREGGAQVITVRDRYGDVIRRVKRYPDGREIILIGNRPRDEIGAPPVIFLPNQLPPIVVRIPRDRYIVDYAEAPVEVIQEALLAPPVEPIERPYSLEEVTRNERLREKMSRIDLDTINFEFGSATIEPGEMQTLDRIGQAMQAVLSEHPDEVYLIEGHTDLVGSDSDNLVLSDERAESIAVALSQNYDIPPENLVTEGYGEQYPKVDTEGPERENRRVTVRRITPLLAKGDDQAQDEQDDQSSQTP